MKIFTRLYSWWLQRRAKPLDQLLSVEFDDNEVRVIVLDKMDDEWNQRFLWADIWRVCFKDEGPYSSDSIRIELKDRLSPVVILTDAQGGDEFFEALTARGYFSEEVCRRAMRETRGATYCWPEKLPENNVLSLGTNVHVRES